MSQTEDDGSEVDRAVKVISSCKDCEVTGGHDGLDEPSIYPCKKHEKLADLWPYS